MVDLASHARHDRFAIADALGGGALPATVRTCPSCGALHRDLLSIQTAIRHAWTPRRPRDLRPRPLETWRRGAWRRLIEAIGTSGDAITRPLALGLTALGIAGLVLANVPPGAGSALGRAGAASVTPEIARPSSSAPHVGTPVDRRADVATREPDALALAAAATLAAGGATFGIRRLAGPRRAVR